MRLAMPKDATGKKMKPGTNPASLFHIPRPGVSFTGQCAVRLADDIAVLGPDHHVRPHHADLDLFSIADLSDNFGIVSERVLAA